VIEKSYFLRFIHWFTYSEKNKINAKEILLRHFLALFFRLTAHFSMLFLHG